MMSQLWACAVEGLLGLRKVGLQKRNRLQARRGPCLPASAGKLHLPQLRLR